PRMAVESGPYAGADARLVRQLRKRRIEEAADKHILRAGPHEWREQLGRAAPAAASRICARGGIEERRPGCLECEPQAFREWRQFLSEAGAVLPSEFGDLAREHLRAGHVVPRRHDDRDAVLLAVREDEATED